ncbi:hypothetical protein ACWEPL_40440 [Nonomuraea sp. NPDC004186]
MAHGHPDDEDLHLICEVLPALAEQAGPPVYRQGGGDSITYVFGPPGAAAAATFETAVRAVARGGASPRCCPVAEVRSCPALQRTPPPRAWELKP